MRDIFHDVLIPSRRTVDLSGDERCQLNTIIDLLIPADEDFPPPSSLQLIDEFLFHLLPHAANSRTPMLHIQRLRTVLRDLTTFAGGNFCKAPLEKQKALLKHLEMRDPAFFQTLLTLVSHSYYSRLAIS